MGRGEEWEKGEREGEGEGGLTKADMVSIAE